MNIHLTPALTLIVVLNSHTRYPRVREGLSGLLQLGHLGQVQLYLRVEVLVRVRPQDRFVGLLG